MQGRHRPPVNGRLWKWRVPPSRWLLAASGVELEDGSTKRGQSDLVITRPAPLRCQSAAAAGWPRGETETSASATRGFGG